MIAVSNSTPLIALAKGDSLSLLALLFNNIAIPDKVYQEVVVQGFGKAGSQEVEQARQAGWIIVQSPHHQEKAVELASDKIDLAEAEAIILASEKQPEFLIMDDMQAREIAEKYLANIKTRLIHSATVLTFAKQQELIANVKPALDKMRQRGVWIKDEDYMRILTLAGESNTIG